MKLKVPATQRHHPEHAARSRWLAISQDRFLCALPKYIRILSILLLVKKKCWVNYGFKINKEVD